MNIVKEEKDYLTNVVLFRKSLPNKENSDYENGQSDINFPRMESVVSVCRTYVPRKESLTFLDIKNAHARAEWVRKYFSGHFCDDLRSTRDQHRYALWHWNALHRAQRFLRGAHGS